MSQAPIIDLSVPAQLAAYRAGRAESERTDSDPALCRCPYQERSLEWFAFNRGWNSHYPDTEPPRPRLEPALSWAPPPRRAP